jgi:hypothetical protein
VSKLVVGAPGVGCRLHFLSVAEKRGCYINEAGRVCCTNQRYRQLSAKPQQLSQWNTAQTLLLPPPTDSNLDILLEFPPAFSFPILTSDSGSFEL